MVKNTAIKRISETFNVQFRAEIFNIFNHANFLPPEPVNGQAGAAGIQYGRIGVCRPTAVANRLPGDPTARVQFALKVIW